MNMFRTSILTILSVSFLCCSTIVSAQKSGAVSKKDIPKGFASTANGLIFQQVRKSKTGSLPKISDIVSFRARYSLQRGKSDSLLFDSKNNPGGFVTLQLSIPEYKGDLMEGLAMLQPGDSAIFLVPADSFFMKTIRVETLPPFIKPGERMRFEIGMAEVNTVEQMQKKQALQDSIAQIEMKTVNEKEMQVLLAKMQEKGDNQMPESSGLIIINRKSGNGIKPKPGQKVSVHYTGTLLNGTVFDSSVERNQPISFTLGQGEVIKGWDEGIAAIEVGGKATLMIPSWLGYGARSVGPIPANSSLIFEVELINIE